LKLEFKGGDRNAPPSGGVADFCHKLLGRVAKMQTTKKRNIEIIEGNIETKLHL